MQTWLKRGEGVVRGQGEMATATSVESGPESAGYDGSCSRHRSAARQPRNRTRALRDV